MAGATPLGPDKEAGDRSDSAPSSSSATLDQPQSSPRSTPSPILSPPTKDLTPALSPPTDDLTPAAVPAAAQDGEEPGAPEAGRTSLQTTAIILALASALFLAALDVTIVTVAIPTIALEFHSTAGYTWIGSAYMLATAAAAPMWGKISDIWGRKPIMLIAVAVFWIGSLLSAVSKGMGMLIVARAVQGVGGGGIVILVNVCISDLFSMRKRGVYFGAMGMVWAVASAVGPILGGVFTSNVTWRWCFYINLPISGVGMVVLAYVLKLHNPRTPMRQGLKAVDWLGSLTVVGATLMIMLGLELGGVTHPWSSPTVICLLVFGVVTGALFVLIEWKFAEFPLVPMHLFRHWASAASLLVGALHGFVFISGSYYLPLYFQAVIGASPLMSGVYVLPWVMSLSLVSAATGIVIKKSGKYLPPLIFGMAVMTLGFGLFIDLEPRANWTKIVLYQLVAGIGVGPLFQSPLIALQTTVSGRDMASATGTFAFVRQLFSAVSIVIGGVVFQNGMQKQYPDLLAQLGPEVAQLLSGSNAASSVGLVGELPPAQRAVARQAYFDSLRTMYIMYVAFSAVGLAVGCFVGSRPLSKDHTEHKTGLDAMRLNKQDGEGGMSSGASSGATLDEERGMVAAVDGEKKVEVTADEEKSALETADEEKKVLATADAETVVATREAREEEKKVLAAADEDKAVGTGESKKEESKEVEKQS